MSVRIPLCVRILIGLAIVAAIGTVRADDPAYDDFAVVFHRLSLEPQQGARGQPAKTCGHFGALRAVAHDIPGTAAAGNEQQGVHHDGFAGTGFAGQGGQPFAKLEFRLIDDDEIAQLKMREHPRSIAHAAAVTAAAPVQLRAQ